MSVCGQCGKKNPEGLIYCGYCAAPLDANPDGDSAAQKPGPLPPEPSAPTPPRLRPLITDPPEEEKKGGIEWIPWKELTFGQKTGRVFVTVLVLALGFAVIRIALDFALHHGSSAASHVAAGNHTPLSAGDRKDGVESLCKVFQIYGVPRTTADAQAAARSAQELFKLGGSESPGRSAFILQTIALEFQSGKLKARDCAAAGEAIPTASSDGSTGPGAP